MNLKRLVQIFCSLLLSFNVAVVTQKISVYLRCLHKPIIANVFILGLFSMNAFSGQIAWFEKYFPAPNNNSTVVAILSNGNSACASYDGVNCLWGDPIGVIDFSRVTPLVCTSDQYYPGHWCYETGKDISGSTAFKSTLVGYWSFDDCTANDNSNNGLSGTAYSGVSCVQSAWGKAFSFDGTNGYVEIPYPQALTGGSSFTASFLMQFNPLNKRQWVLFFGEPSRWVSAHWLIRENNISQFGFYSDGIAQGMYSLIDLSPFVTKWTHVVTTYDANTNQLISYINGVKQSTDYPATKANLLPSKFYIGKNVYSASDANYSGNLDELRLYNRALSGLEVAQLYNSIQNHPVQYNANGHYYEYVPEVVDWNTAKQRAESKTYQGMKGHLATITSAEENNFVIQSFPNTTGYLGATDKETNGTWKWVTGEAFSYANWNSGEPNNLGNNCNGESYAHYWQGTNGKWNDIADDNQCYNLATYVSGYYVEYEPVTKFSDLVDMEKSGVNIGAGEVVLYFKTIPEWFDVRLFIGGDLVSASPQLVADNQNPGAKYVIFKTNLQNIAYLNKLVEAKVWVKNAQTPVFGTVYGVIDQAKSTILASRTLSETKPTNNNECTTALGVSSPCNNYFVSDEIPDFNADETGYGAKATFLETTTHRIIDFDKVVKWNNINATWNQSNYGRQPGGDNGRIPLLLIHGWQGSNGFRNPAKLGLWESSELHYWQHFLDYYLLSPELQNKYHVYLYHYPSYKHVTYNAKVLDDLLAQISHDSPQSDLARPKSSFATKPQDALTIIAHSMGGLVARSLIEEYQGLDKNNWPTNQLNQLITLDTPHHGSTASNPSKWLNNTAKDLLTHGASDLMWDNYDNRIIGLESEYINNEYRWREDRINAKNFDQAYCSSLTCSTINPWLKKLNSNFDDSFSYFSKKYTLYVAWMSGDDDLNTLRTATPYNTIENGVAYNFANEVGIPDLPNGVAEPVTSALLSKSSILNFNQGTLIFPFGPKSHGESPLVHDLLNLDIENAKSFKQFSQSLLPVRDNKQLASILISNQSYSGKYAHPYKIPYRIFWDYDHEKILNGAYPASSSPGIWDVFVKGEDVYTPNLEFKVNALDKFSAFYNFDVRNKYIYSASSFLGLPVSFNDNIFLNPLRFEPVYLVLNRDLLTPKIATQDSLNMGTINKSSSSYLRITNEGVGDLKFISYSISSDSGVFRLSNIGLKPCPRGGAVLVQSQSCNLSVNVALPNTNVPLGIKRAKVYIQTNDLERPVLEIPVLVNIVSQ